MKVDVRAGKSAGLSDNASVGVCTSAILGARVSGSSNAPTMRVNSMSANVDKDVRGRRFVRTF